LTQAQSISRSLPQTTLRRHFCIVIETFAPEIKGVALTLARLIAGLRARKHKVSLVRIGLPASGVLRRVWTQRRPDVAYVATQGPLGWSAVCVARSR